MKAEQRPMTKPIISPPTAAPITLPNPPTMATKNTKMSQVKSIVGVMDYIKAIHTPPTAALANARPYVMAVTRSISIPDNIAPSLSCHTA